MEEIMRCMLENIRAEVPCIGKLGKLSESDLLRICEKVDSIDTTKQKCWIWNGTVQDKAGKGHQHGCIWYNKKYVQTHRIMYHNFIEDVPEYRRNGLMVLHKCSHENNGRCINPWHMKLGAAKENTHDALQSGTLALDGLKGHSKLTDDQIEELISLKGTISQRDAAIKFKLTRVQIGKYWQKADKF